MEVKEKEWIIGDDRWTPRISLAAARTLVRKAG
jgi:hypothetical protein